MDQQSRASLPTPNSDTNEGNRGAKRKRVPARVDEQDEEAVFNKYFDPNQDPEVRRDVKRRSRALERRFQGKRLSLRCMLL